MAKLKIIPLGGLGEIGKNLTVYEYGQGACALVRTSDCAVLVIDDDITLSACEDFLMRTYGGELDAVAVTGENTARAVNVAAFLPAREVRVRTSQETGFRETNVLGGVRFEYGGLSGIVSLHDLMEALVGDLSDMETEKKPDDIEKVAENCWKIYGAADLEDVSEELDIELPIEVYDTFGGFLCGALGRIPEDGEIFTVPLEGFTVQVEQVENRRIGLTTVTRNEEKEDEAESEDA